MKIFDNVIIEGQSLAVGTSSADASSILDLVSTTTGFLAPRMTTTEINAIVSPATGLQIYNTTANSLYIYNGATWVAVGAGESSVSKSGTSYTALPADFTGNENILFTDSTGNTTVTLPAASAVTVGLQLRFTMLGGNTLTLIGAQTLDGQTISGGGKIITQPDYTGTAFIPAHSFGLYSDGTAWHTSINF